MFAGEHDPEQMPLSFESLRWFMLLEATHWTHLPVTGGWHEQHPAFVEEVMTIFEVKAAHDKADAERRERDQQHNSTFQAAQYVVGNPGTM